MKTTTTASAASAPTTQPYGEPWYWDTRYSNEPGPFDWYQKYQTLAPLINLYASRNHRILVVGCGNSENVVLKKKRAVFLLPDVISPYLKKWAFSEGMVHDGYEDVVNIDISSVVIEAMQKKYQNLPQLKYMKMDVRDMGSFQADSFSAVFDKGTLDSLLCGTNSQINANKMLQEVWRVLKNKGVYILVTYGAPLYRLNLLKDSCLWTIKLHMIGKLGSEESSGHPAWELTIPVLLDDGNSVEQVLGNYPDVHFIYVCTKDNSLKTGLKHDEPVQ